MNKIFVKNGDWDKARSELGAQLEARKNAFDAKLEAVFAPVRKDAAPAVAPQPSRAEVVLKKQDNGLLLSRSRMRG